MINVFMEVASVDGDYSVIAQIDTINGEPADTHSPRLFLSLYNDAAGLKGIIDETRTLLMPKRFQMAGELFEDGTNRFTVSGSFELAPGDPDNPYQTTLRRDITLLGDRSEFGDAQLGPLDLKGEYRETIRNVLSEPIYLAGTFRAERLQNEPSAIGMLGVAGPNTPAAIVDSGQIVLNCQATPSFTR